MAEKETIMKLKVNLQCEKCYKKVKKVLCKFPQIRDQAYLVKDNLVVIKVVCCNPEKIRDKICCKGCGVIKTIEIVEPPKPKDKKKETEKTEEPDKKKESEKKEKEPDKKKESEKKEEEPKKKKEEEKPTPRPGCPPRRPVCCGECYAGRPGGPCFHGHGVPPTKPATPPTEPRGCSPRRPVCCGECYAGRPGGPCFHGYGGPPTKPATPPTEPPVKVPPRGCSPPRPIPTGVCCEDCYAGRPGGPCFQGYGGPPIWYDGYYGRPVYDSYGGPRPCYVSRCDQYFSEESASGCSIM